MIRSVTDLDWKLIGGSWIVLKFPFNTLDDSLKVYWRLCGCLSELCRNSIEYHCDSMCLMCLILVVSNFIGITLFWWHWIMLDLCLIILICQRDIIVAHLTFITFQRIFCSANWVAVEHHFDALGLHWTSIGSLPDSLWMLLDWIEFQCYSFGFL